MSRGYEVHIFDADGRWLAQESFPKRPARNAIEQVFPVLARGRHEVRICQANNGGIVNAWQQGEGRGLADLPIEEARAQARPVRKPRRTTRSTR